MSFCRRKISWKNYIEQYPCLDKTKSALPALCGLETHFNPSPEIFSEEKADLTKMTDVNYLIRLGETLDLRYNNDQPFTKCTQFLFIDSQKG